MKGLILLNHEYEAVLGTLNATPGLRDKTLDLSWVRYDTHNNPVCCISVQVRAGAHSRPSSAEATELKRGHGHKNTVTVIKERVAHLKTGNRVVNTCQEYALIVDFYLAYELQMNVRKRRAEKVALQRKIAKTRARLAAEIDAGKHVHDLGD